MKTLPEKLRKNGFDYELVQRDANRAIYKQHVSENCHYWEVFRIRKRKESIFKGKQIPEREIFPSDEDFGYTAWTCMTLERAMERYNLLEP